MSKRGLESYHLAWLSAHPHRNEQWLNERLADGFDVHHIDGDHSNDASENLVLIECVDHMMLHGAGHKLCRLRVPGQRKGYIKKGHAGGHPRGPSGRKLQASERLALYAAARATKQ